MPKSTVKGAVKKKAAKVVKPPKKPKAKGY